MRVLFRFAVAVLTMAMLLACYVAAYLWTVETELTVLTGVGPWNLRPHYSSGGRAAEVFFYPIHALDRMVRRDRWLVTDDVWEYDEYSRKSNVENG